MWRIKYIFRFYFPYLYKIYFHVSERKDKKTELLNIYHNSTDYHIKMLLEFVKKHRLGMYNYEFNDRYFYKKCKVYYDTENSLFYVIHKGKRLYMARRYNNPYKVINLYNSLCSEQDLQSPHKYYSKNFSPLGNKGRGIMADIGAAEGMIALEFVDQMEYVYLFECDEEWIEALKLTFMPYKDKTEIVARFVTNIDDEYHIQLDTFFADRKVTDIKMDIEGAELDTLNGARELLKRKDIRWSVCCYHNPQDEKLIGDVFKENNIKYDVVEGYVYIPDEKQPSLRHAMIRAWGNM